MFPPLLPVGIMRKLQAGLILNDDGDKVIFRQFGGESSLRTLESGHTAIRADQFDPDGWNPPETAELCKNNDQGFVIKLGVGQRSFCTKDRDARTTIHQWETMPHYPHAVEDHSRRSH